MVAAKSVVRAGLVLGFLLVSAGACSSKADDGASCDKGRDCASGQCTAGACVGSECTCEGADCRSQSSCQAGWLCTRGDVFGGELVPHCRQQCTGTGQCAGATHCADGVCADGPEPFALRWVNIPRAHACAANMACEYTVRPADGVTVDTYTWKFGSAAPVVTHDPTTFHTYPTAGSYDVVVQAKSTAGAVGDLRTTDALCAGALGGGCDVAGPACCEGSCTLGVCK